MYQFSKERKINNLQIVQVRTILKEFKKHPTIIPDKKELRGTERIIKSSSRWTSVPGTIFLPCVWPETKRSKQVYFGDSYKARLSWVVLFSLTKCWVFLDPSAIFFYKTQQPIRDAKIPNRHCLLRQGITLKHHSFGLYLVFSAVDGINHCRDINKHLIVRLVWLT